MKRYFLPGLLSVVLVGWLSAPALAKVRVPRVFADHMVLQREKPVPVWGWAEPGEKVSVRFAGEEKSAVAAADGNWSVRLDPLTASDKPAELTITATNTIVLRDVLVGDVWVCSGDFGAFWEVFACVNAEAEISSADLPTLRLLKVVTKSSNTPLNDIQGEWLVSSPTSVTGFSGLGYFFGRTLHRELNVPIGLIDCSYRYSYMRSWTPPEGFRMVPELASFRERLDSWDSTTPTGEKAYHSAVAQVEKWLPLAEKALQDQMPIPPQPLMPAPIAARDDNYVSIGELSVAYFGMVRPLMPFAIRGVIWSQGENGGEADSMQGFLRGMCQAWRKAWGQGDFPFYFEMLPQIGPPDNAPTRADSWTVTREGQLKSLSLPNSGMAVTFDVSDFVQDSRNRQDAGRRLALWALAKEYRKNLVCSGPIFKSHRVEGNQVILTFDHVGGGLMVGEKSGLAPTREAKNGVLKQFAVAGADKQWYAADARIVGETVVVRSDKVPAPVAVRYAWNANPQGANLYNRDGLPATPLRTDNW